MGPGGEGLAMLGIDHLADEHSRNAVRRQAGTGALTIMFVKSIRVLGIAVSTAALLAVVNGLTTPAPALAQAEAPKKTAPPSAAEQALNRGIEAYNKNSLARAIGACSSALSSGGLENTGTARALYYRGLAYRKQGQTALAITDLTNALWLKNGLSEKERADAVSNRAAAYQAAGIADPGAPQADPAPAPAVAASAPASSSSDTPTPPAPRAATAAAAAAPAPTEASGNNAPLSGIGKFFGNLFSGGSTSSSGNQQAEASPAAAPSDLTTASTGAATTTSSWNSNTEVGTATEKTATAAEKPKRQRTAALKNAAVKTDAEPVAAAPATGKFRLQLAAVRSRAKADELLQRFSAKYGASTGGRTPVIEEAVFGNMGTFYRVNIGPYASAAEPEKLCNSVRSSGFDCLVVTH